MSTNIEIPAEFREWMDAELENYFDLPPGHSIGKNSEAARRKEAMVFIAECAYRHLMGQSSPAGRWVKLSKKLPSDGMEKSAKFTYSDGSHKLSFLAGDSKHLFIGDETMWEIANIPADVMEMWEWLDPSPEPAKEEQPWISVQDDLPQDQEEVLALNAHGRIIQKSWWHRADQDYRWFRQTFTHWMPIPSLPQPLQEPKK